MVRWFEGKKRPPSCWSHWTIPGYWVTGPGEVLTAERRRAAAFLHLSMSALLHESIANIPVVAASYYNLHFQVKVTPYSLYSVVALFFFLFYFFM